MPVGRSVLQGQARNAAGQRDKWVTVQTKTPATATSGYPKNATWVDSTTLFMSRHDVRADERAAAGLESAFAETIWHAPYVESLDPEVVDVPATKRLVYKGRTYNIRSASLLDRKTGIEFVTLAQVRA